MTQRKILHVDMDAFFASVEQRDRPELRGRPVVVGGPARSRGVVCAASYEARKFGVRSAMSCSEAARRCPDAIFVPPDFARYSTVSQVIRGIFLRFAHKIEPLSLDEAYLDVTTDPAGVGSATAAAIAIRAAIRAETGLTASAGVAPNKFLAKVASDHHKPDGLCVIKPDAVQRFLEQLPVRRVPGIGTVTEARCQALGIKVCPDFLRFPEALLTEHFGSYGRVLQAFARGEDDRPVVADGVRKSVGIEDTFEKDLQTAEEAQQELARLAHGLIHRADRAGVFGHALTLKVKTKDFQVITRRRTAEDPFDAPERVLEVATALLPETPVARTPVRLLGLQLSQLQDRAEGRQLPLPFEPALAP